MRTHCETGDRVLDAIDRPSRNEELQVLAESLGLHTLRLSGHVGVPNMASELAGK